MNEQFYQRSVRVRTLLILSFLIAAMDPFSSVAGESFYKKHYEPNDVVAQVLNYSDLGKDVVADTAMGFWYAKSKCVYAKAGKDSFDNDKFKGELEIIDLNKIDPRTVTIGARMMGGIYPPYPFVQVGTERRFAGPGIPDPPLDKGRLERGWSLIFSKHCTGTQKAF